MQRFAFLLILVAWAHSALAESEVYISARSDGQAGTGAAADPFNGSTQEKFDGVLAKLGPGTTIHVGAGTFHTKGEASFKLQPNTKIRGTGILLQNLQHSLVTNNIVVDSGNHRDLLIISTKGFSSSVTCRDNYHPDLTALMPRDGKLNIIPSGLLDLPLEAGKGIALMPNNGKIRIEATGIGAGATGEANAPPIARQVSPVGPAANHNAPGKPGDYALQSGYLYLYTGDGTAHEWKRIQRVDY